jgi:transcriptional regulator with XRE-family HTH domain
MTTSTVMKTLRRQRRISQFELAQAVGVSQPTISMWENGLKRIPEARRERIGRILSVAPDALDREVA